MKLLYKIIIFFTVFYGIIIMVNSMDIFPTTLYQDIDPGIANPKSPEGILAGLFTARIDIGPFHLNTASAAAITTFIIGISIAAGIFTQNPTIPSVAIVGILFFNMMSNSYTFINGLFNKFGNQQDSIIYLGVTIGATVLVVGWITIVEMVAQGRSGGD